MSSDMNTVAVTGNLTRDPDLRATTGGTQVLTFGIAIDDSRKNQQTGKWEDHPNFINCVVFGVRAESLSRLLVKGMKVAVSGKLHYSSWETKDGQKRNKIEIMSSSVVMMSISKERPSNNEPSAYDDDIPF